MNTNHQKDRVKEIISVSLKHGFKKGVNNPKQLKEMLEELGPTFVKIGQILSTRPDILPSEYIVELQKLQDDVKPESFQTIVEVIKSELGSSIDDIFPYFEKTPIASASLAEVHLAKLKTGEEVVVKIQRPNVLEKMSADINILKKLAPFINLTPTGSAMDAREVVEELAHATEKELDFINEKENIEKFSKNNRDVKFMICPNVYSEYCTDKIIVMDKGKIVEEGNPQSLLSQNGIYSKLIELQTLSL